MVGSCHIIALCDGDFGVFVAFFLKVAFGKDFGAVNQKSRYIDIVGLRALDAAGQFDDNGIERNLFAGLASGQEVLDRKSVV